MPHVERRKRSRVLDPVERTSEVIFGLLMAMTFIGSISVATGGGEEVRTLLIAAIGCNLAWGLADAVMYLVRAATERSRKTRLLAQLHGADAAEGRSLISDALPPHLATASGGDVLETMRQRLLGLPEPPRQALLGRADFTGALGVFLLVVLATFPVVVPFMLIDQTAFAVRVSNLVAVAMLLVAGTALARYAGAPAWQGGLAMAVTGSLLLAAIIALGG
jgi:VIT1/CCC1 family predicted Fe2+/Mn2+ transporter